MWETVALGNLIPTRGSSVDPKRFPDEVFELHSVPAHDSGSPEILYGTDIGSTKQLVQPGDVLLSKIVPHIRRSHVVGEVQHSRQIASSEWIIFRGAQFAPDYLRHLLVGDGFHKHFMATVSGVGGSLLRARPQHVRTIQVPRPPMEEQRRIAAVLDQADEIRAKRRAQLALLDELPQSLFHEMFESRTWPVELLGDLLQFLTSGSRGWAKYYSDFGAKFIRIQNVRDGELLLNDLAYVSAPNTAEAKRTLVQAGDVLLSITADLGRVAVVPASFGAAHISQHLALLRAPSLVPSYLVGFLLSSTGQREVLGKDRGATKAGLNFDDVRSIRLPVPPIPLQEEFAEQVEAIQAERERVARALEADDELFAALQYRAFRGEL